MDASHRHAQIGMSPRLSGMKIDAVRVGKSFPRQLRDKALGLFASLARDLGIPGYKKGKKPKLAKDFDLRLKTARELEKKVKAA